MDMLDVEDRITELIKAHRLADAEAELKRAREQASNDSDQQAVEHVLTSLAHLYCAMEPPQHSQAEECFAELERITGDADAKAQTAMMLYWSMHDAMRTVAKAEEAIEAAEHEHDESTMYQCFSLMGLALLDLHRLEDASQVLRKIEQMVESHRRIVVGDEALFFERLFAAEPRSRGTITKLAKTLWPMCREQQFAERLKILADA